MPEKICVVGLGYIGLPTASVLATHGLQVLGVEIADAVRNSILRGMPPIEEPGLKTIVEAALKSGNLTVEAKPSSADAFIICVPTPFNEKTKKADLSFVVQAAESIAPYLKAGNLVVLESTVPPGTTENLLIPILTKKSKLKIPGEVLVAHCPERVLPGQLLTELVSNDRIIGGVDEASSQAARAIYAKFATGKIFITNSRVAETVKLAENTYRDINVAYANELDLICARLGIDVWEVIRLANRHPRVNILRPGPGVGGHCIAVDPWFLATAVSERDSRLIRTARAINDAKPDAVIRRLDLVLSKVKPKSKPVKIAVLGVTYKANVDDIRGSPALNVIGKLSKRKDLKLLIADPHGHRLNGSIPLVPLETAIEEGEVILLLVDHREFTNLNWAGIMSEKGKDRILDCKGILSREEYEKSSS